MAYPATATGWTKWRPSDPTSPRWYEIDHFTALIAAYLNREQAGGRARTLREFVAEFQGLSASAKQKAVLEVADLPRGYLHDLVEGNAIREADAARLLQAMQGHARPVRPQMLGVLGRDHLVRVLTEYHGCDAETIHYKKVAGEAEGVPFVLEVAFGVVQDRTNEEAEARTITGINWSATLTAPFERLSTYLNTALVQPSDPVVVVAHLAIPRPTFRDRGKQAMSLPDDIEYALGRNIASVTQRWTAAKHSAFRSHWADAQAAERLRRQARAQYPSVKKAAYQLMPAAYQAASGQGRYVAHARQIMYAARRQILAMIHPDKAAKGLNDQYFTQSRLVLRWAIPHAENGILDSWNPATGRPAMMVTPKTW